MENATNSTTFKKIKTNACEINAVLHCNLTCRACSHRSPIFKKNITEPEVVYRDLKLLSKYVAPNMIRVVGGEPLLHPNIEELIEAIRRSDAAPWIRVVTNGVLLTKASQRFWSLVDEVYVSQYPGFHLDQQQLNSISEIAQAFKVTLKLNIFNHFRESLAGVESEDAELTRRIYNSCRIAHTWQCHAVHKGHYYLCPISLFQYLKPDGEFATDAIERVALNESEYLGESLRSLILRKTPLESCKKCLGNAGIRFDHSQTNRRDWMSSAMTSPKDLVDIGILNRLEREPDLDGD